MKKTISAILFLVVFLTPTIGLAAYIFSNTLRIGMTTPDVKELQKILNKDSLTKVATVGPGSPGFETNYFGTLTQKSVITLQQKHGLVPDGIVGPKTIAKLATTSSSGTSVNTTPNPYSTWNPQSNSSSNPYYAPNVPYDFESISADPLNITYLHISSISDENPAPGETIDIHGEGFSKTSNVYLGIKKKVAFEFIDSEHFKLKVPSNYADDIYMLYMVNSKGDTSLTQPVSLLVTEDEVDSGSEDREKKALVGVKKANDMTIALAKNEARKNIFLSFKNWAANLGNAMGIIPKKALAQQADFFGGSISSTQICSCLESLGTLFDVDDLTTSGGGMSTNMGQDLAVAYVVAQSSLRSNYNLNSSGINVIGGSTQGSYSCETQIYYPVFECTDGGDEADVIVDMMRGVGTSQSAF